MFRSLPSSFRSSLRRSLRCAALLLTLPVLGAVSARADYTTTVQPTTSYGVWDGWGCSLAWWANVFGTRDDLADLAVDELVDMTGVDETSAKALIMKAREHWFTA